MVKKFLFIVSIIFASFWLIGLVLAYWFSIGEWLRVTVEVTLGVIVSGRSRVWINEHLDIVQIRYKYKT